MFSCCLRTNNVSLRRLENKGKKQGAVNSQGPPQTVQTCEKQENEEREENDDEFVQRTGAVRLADAEDDSADYAGLSVEQRRRLTTLHVMFPQMLLLTYSRLSSNVGEVSPKHRSPEPVLGVYGGDLKNAHTVGIEPVFTTRSLGEHHIIYSTATFKALFMGL
ncbi:hypothetical protein DPMN_142842 [Dreissena polymorpha]|uniref:Uncharacterized protein n=1 Tax=Dreissena polymorpha TaxID=45954 RepID=A0A9D4GF50_DREPO|nr:hypothetical protein DPMN_142842 [Dreissena polymorpha]